MQGPFTHSGSVQINVIHISTQAFSFQVTATENYTVLETVKTAHTAKFTPFVVGWQSNLSASLDVDGHQIQTPSVTSLFEQMVPQLKKMLDISGFYRARRHAVPQLWLRSGRKREKHRCKMSLGSPVPLFLQTRNDHALESNTQSTTFLLGHDGPDELHASDTVFGVEGVVAGDGYWQTFWEI